MRFFTRITHLYFTPIDMALFVGTLIKRQNSGFIVGLCVVMLASFVIAAQPTDLVDFNSLKPDTFAPGELLVKFKTPDNTVKNANAFAAALEARHALNARIGVEVLQEYSLIPVCLVKVPQGMSLAEAAALYAADPNVAYVEPNYLVYPDAVPNDPLYSLVWGMRRINAPAAWDRTTGSSNILVAVIDTGILRTHEDLAANMWRNPGETGLDGLGRDKATNGIDDDGNGFVDDVNGWDFCNNDNDPTDDHGHGTHVAGTIGAVGNNNTGVVGVNWNVKIVALKFLSAAGPGYISDAIKAVQYAATKIPGVKITNNSWGGGGYTQALKDAIDAAGALGQLFVAAAGNTADNNDGVPHYPSSYTSPNIISVASIDGSGGMSYFSCFGFSSVDIGAPGSGILSTGNDGGYNTKNGTSMACPHVAGAAALLWSKYPAAPWDQIRSALLDGARPNAALAGKVATGGELDLVSAFAQMNAPMVTPNPAYVREGSTTNLSVTLRRQPSADSQVTPTWLSGSTNLYVVGSPVLIFTPTNWAIPQTFQVGSLYDLDMTNDVAIMQLSASGGDVGNTTFILEQQDLGDNIPPKCSITGSLRSDLAQVWFDFAFDEKVTGFTGADLLATSSNIMGGISLIDLTDLTGSNRLYRARYSVGSLLGSVTLTIPASSLTDQSGLHNANLQYNTIFTLPWLKTDFADDFEHGSTWTRSTNVYADLTSDIWRFGPPVFGASWAGPVQAASGSNCWGVMDGPYSLSYNGWILSPPIAVGANPVLNFNLWMWTGGIGYVEVNGANGWMNVSPSGVLLSTAGAWNSKSVALDNAQYGNRVIQLRFRADNSSTMIEAHSAMYIDDVSVKSERDPAIWLVSESPTNGPAGTNTPVSFVVYNSTTTTLSTVKGAVTSPDAGVSVVSGSPVTYGTLAPGGVSTGAAPISLQLAAAGNFDSPVIQLIHNFTDANAHSYFDQQPFTVNGVTNSQATNLFLVESTTGVTNWLGQFLSGNGSDLSCLFQVISAGSNRVVDLPTASGQVTGDDRILYSYGTRQSSGRFGEGSGVAPNLGTFSKLFTHNLASNDLVFVRAWDGSSFKGSAAYGNSALYPIKLQASQTNDFGSWAVAISAPGSFALDSNGDSIPDGWCVLSGLDPRQLILPLGAQVISAREATDFSYPSRIAVSSNYVFVADTENSRVQVWGRELTNRWYTLGSSIDTNFSKPRGIAVSRDGTRVAVADTAYRRVRIFSVNPTNGVLTALFMFGSNGTAPGQFNDPMAVAFGTAGEIYVADSQQSGTCNNRVQIFDAAGVFQQTYGSAGSGDGQFNRLLGIGMGRDGTLYAADGANHRVQAFTSGSSFAGKFGANGTIVGKFNRVWDTQSGVGGLLYVTDFYNDRIQVLNASNPAVMAVVGVYSNAGMLGAFNLPQSAAPAPDDNVLYVADTYNSRVLRLKVTMDSDGDGMDDVWEVLHGLNPNDPADALIDSDGDGVLNIGEYRAGTDPRKKDTDGDRAGDGWEMANGLNPLVSNSVSGTIPTFISITVSPASPVRAGQTVLITATYSQTITNAPSLTLSGAVALGPIVMAGAGTTWSYSYLVPASVAGAVNGAISGAIGISGNLSDPPTAYSNALFTITGEDLIISAITPLSGHLAWNAWSGDVYKIQSSTNLLTTNWVDGVSVTSSVSGTLNVSNVFATTNQVQFMRVLWLGVP